MVDGQAGLCMASVHGWCMAWPRCMGVVHGVHGIWGWGTTWILALGVAFEGVCLIWGDFEMATFNRQTDRQTDLLVLPPTI